MKAFYCDHFVLPLPDGHKFPMAKYARLRELVKTPTLERLTLITVEDQKLWDEAGELIQKYVAPRVRAK